MVKEIDNKLFVLAIIAFGILGIAIGFSICTLLSTPSIKSEIDYFRVGFDKVNLTYDGLNQGEIDFFESIFYEINPLFFEENNNFLVTNNISNYCNDCSGQNKNKGEKIEIYFLLNKPYLRNLLSHEIIHTYIPNSGGKDTTRHKIVYFLGEKGVVFK